MFMKWPLQVMDETYYKFSLSYNTKQKDGFFQAQN